MPDAQTRGTGSGFGALGLGRGAAALRAYALATMYAAGATLGLASYPAAATRGLQNTTLLLICLVALPASALIVRFGPNWPTWAFHPALAAGTLIMFVSVWFGGAEATPGVYGMLMVWVALYAGYFFSARIGLVHGAFALGGYAALVATQGQDVIFEVIWLAGISIVVGGISHWLAHGRTPTQLDPLTALVNRSGLTERLTPAMARAEDHHEHLCVALIDLDHFQHLNATLGHDVGDRALVQVAQNWQRGLPADATLARYGGDEFVVVMPGLRLTDARVLIDELRTLAPHGLTCSAGVAPWVPGDSLSLLLTRADTALYEAKRLGRNRTASVGEDSDLAAELWHALEADQFSVHYQPVVGLGDGSLLGFEALVRWEHPERGTVGPNAFIEAAEASGAIHALGRWVLSTACHQLAAWRLAAPGLDLTMAVNLSPVQLEHPRLVADVESALVGAGLPGSALVLEVTEGAILGGLTEPTAVLWQLRGLDVRLAIDDFGTGHSSLDRLRSMPFDVLKIDRTFVRVTDTDHGGRSLLSAIVGMADSLGLLTVAEGVEGAEELRLVREHGCAQAQGFLLGYPSRPEDLLELIASGTVELCEGPDAAKMPTDCLPVQRVASSNPGAHPSGVWP